MEITASKDALAFQASDPTSMKKASKLHEAAQQFEALMLGEVLKTVRSGGSDGWLGSGDGTGDDSAMDMAQNELANVLASSGGFGLAHMIEQKMHSQNVNAAREKDSTGS
jgi:Rod binding domain-containing protein